MLSVGVLLLCGLPLTAQDSPSPKPTLNYGQYLGVSPSLDELAKLPQPARYGFHQAPPLRLIPKGNFGTGVDTAQRGAAYPAAFAILPLPGGNFLGLGNGFTGYSVPDAPPDTNMAVGDLDIIQWVNVSFTVCHFKSPVPPPPGAGCTPPIAFNTLFPPHTLCGDNNDGDIIAQYDRKAHVWVLMQNVLVSPYAVCFAVSNLPNSLTFKLFMFPVPGNGFPDYPKLGIWSSGGPSDGYFTAMNNFGPGGSGFLGPQICGYDRAKMIPVPPPPPGPVEQICFQLSRSEDSLLPGDVDSPASPPMSQCEFYIGSVGDVDNSHLSLYSMCINRNWGSASVTGSPNTQLLTVASYSGSCGGSFGGDCVPQLGTTSELDSLGDRLMYRFVYWNDLPPVSPTAAVSGFQHWLVNGDVLSNGGQIGVRWYELRANPTTITAATLAGFPPFQQQTYTGGITGDSNYRWMGSIARDNVGNILLGYSESSSAIHPAIGLAGRSAASVPLSTLSAEVLAPIANNGSQPDTSDRWGDYSAMRIDPHDNCTFWYTTEYYMVTVPFDWSTQIISAKFSADPPVC